LLPVLPIARRLVSRGHEVAWITGCAFEQRVVQTGAYFFPWPPAIDSSLIHVYDLYPELGQLKGLARAKFYLKHIFLGTCPVMLDAIDDVLQVFPAQVFIGDNAMFALFLRGEMLGRSSAKLSVLPLGVPSCDTAPFGMGLQPGRNALTRLRDHMLNDFVYSQLLSELNDDANRLRQGLGLAPLDESFLITVWYIPQLVMQMTTPAFEYPRSDLPPHIHFIGPSLPDVSGNFDKPSWWSDLTGPEPVVLINQGTVEADAADLLLPAMEALRNEALLVVALPLREEEVGTLPANVRTSPYIPFERLLPHVDVMVTNGGYGGTQASLAHGVPLVVAGNTDDKMEVAARVAWTGAGINLRTKRPSPTALRRAVQKVLANPAYRQQAQCIGDEFARYDAPRRAVALLEGLLKRSGETRGLYIG
jgi:UDP:flavonoid glycosyltransferase YjiC (YdhE family)